MLLAKTLMLLGGGRFLVREAPPLFASLFIPLLKGGGWEKIYNVYEAPPLFISHLLNSLRLLAQAKRIGYLL